MKDEIIRLGHGSGAGLTQQLIKELFVKNFKLTSLDDGVEIENRVVVSTDAHVVQPLFFPGGDIGKLAVTGTVNDVSMKGAIPKYLLITYIIEEGFKISDLKKITQSVQKAAEKANVKIIAGDTKVVEKGKADGLYLTTTGIGFLPKGVDLSTKKIKNGNTIILNGSLGDHTIAIINAREKMELMPAPKSDCASLNELVQVMLKNGKINFLRDITRGGLATILNEISSETNLGIIIEEKNIPIKKNVKAVTELLGLDPLYLANEGKLVSIVDGDTKNLIKEMKNDKLGRDSAVIGKVTDEVKGVYIRTSIGGLRPLIMQDSDPLPRIC
ncbi:MAG: hydrogenase expression/formation protein HypE [Candidatus Marinimicrobia bacterium]|jgi:hydrogenase expression/formation protein HypE|nr:hydrogenase expression/formation protein HypE [Candidatus Neomarinimicrobiota bacterium]